jgi:hypothetical protein
MNHFLLGKKEALSFLKKNNTSIIKAWEDYRKQVGHPVDTQLDTVFEQMFKAWILSNKKAISLLEKSSATKRSNKAKVPKTSKLDPDEKWS